MKKLALLMMMAVISLGTMAQTKEGDSSFGLTIGGGFDSINHFTIGIDYRYNFTDEIRFTPSITHFVKNDHLSAWAIDLNAQYVFPITDEFSFYPLAGFDLSFWRTSAAGWSKTFNRFGGNIGLGGEFYATKEISLGFEVKYLILKDFSQPMIGMRVGYRF
ncbi:porin family protein [Parabacteroides sp. PF5-9]|uniref:porin family protein n=1 Tax=Parabacteroides sp. PF5-9 TaxID=1742404 RepID=UPI002474B297|nr:porin family protein [Parabacteroides sp. PF5-9]MDH6356440.1 opacity protein-like surface antigen [Parabacteroides sp. PF5-9]